LPTACISAPTRRALPGPALTDKRRLGGYSHTRAHPAQAMASL